MIRIDDHGCGIRHRADRPGRRRCSLPGGRRRTIAPAVSCSRISDRRRRTPPARHLSRRRPPAGAARVRHRRLIPELVARSARGSDVHARLCLRPRGPRLERRALLPADLHPHRRRPGGAASASDGSGGLRARGPLVRQLRRVRVRGAPSRAGDRPRTRRPAGRVVENDAPARTIAVGRQAALEDRCPPGAPRGRARLPGAAHGWRSWRPAALRQDLRSHGGADARTAGR